MKEKKTVKVAFDVDDTLIIPGVALGVNYPTPNIDVINVYQFFQKQGCHMIVWSNQGAEYAAEISQWLGLNPHETLKKGACNVHIAFDDSECQLGVTNVKVKRINNHISRK